jgi:hypothetical protein
MKYKIFFTILLANLIDAKSDHYDILHHKQNTSTELFRLKTSIATQREWFVNRIPEIFSVEQSSIERIISLIEDIINDENCLKKIYTKTATFYEINSMLYELNNIARLEGERSNVSFLLDLKKISLPEGEIITPSMKSVNYSENLKYDFQSQNTTQFFAAIARGMNAIGRYYEEDTDLSTRTISRYYLGEKTKENLHKKIRALEPSILRTVAVQGIEGFKWYCYALAKCGENSQEETSLFKQLHQAALNLPSNPPKKQPSSWRLPNWAIYLFGQKKETGQHEKSQLLKDKDQ